MENTANAMQFLYLAPSAMSPSQSGYLQERKQTTIIQAHTLQIISVCDQVYIIQHIVQGGFTKENFC